MVGEKDRMIHPVSKGSERKQRLSFLPNVERVKAEGNGLAAAARRKTETSWFSSQPLSSTASALRPRRPTEGQELVHPHLDPSRLASEWESYPILMVVAVCFRYDGYGG